MSTRAGAKLNEEQRKKIDIEESFIESSVQMS